ncbi:MAG: serine hydrolase [Minicystis sp.]
MRAANGDCLGYRSLLATARDVCRFGELLLARGRWAGRALLDERFLGRMLAVDPITAAARADPPADEFRRRAYGFLVYLNRSGLWPGVDPDGFALLGAWGNTCLVDPRHDFVFVRLVTPAGRKPQHTLDANPLSETDHGNARLWRTVLRAFEREASWVAGIRRDVAGARLDAQGALAGWARRRGLWH